MFSKIEMTFKHYLALQVIWLLMALGYNMVSIYNLNLGYPPLKEGNPQQTMVLLTPFLLLLILGFAKRYTVYFYFGVLQTASLLFIGVASHFYTFSISGVTNYSSVWSFLFAIVINIFGVAVFYGGLRKSYFLKTKSL